MFRLFGKSFFLILLIMTDLLTSLPVGPPIRKIENANRRNDKIREPGFAEAPKVLEIQLPVKIATKDDLIAWAKYVMSLMASKINITLSAVKDGLSKDSQRFKSPFNREVPPKVQTPNQATSKYTETKNRDRLELPIRPTARQESKFFLPQYPDFGTKNTFDVKDEEVLRNTNDVVVPPSATYLPIPLTSPEISPFREEEAIGKFFYDNLEQNFTNNFDLKPFDEDINLKQSPFTSEGLDELSSRIRFGNFTTINRNTSDRAVPLISVPFEAVITITREQPPEVTTTRNKTKDFIVIPKREPPDEFPPYFERNYTLIDQDGQINVIFDDFPKDDDRNNTRKQIRQETKKDKQNDRKRPTATVSELLQVLGILRKNSKNETDVKLTPPILKVIKGPTPQKIETAPAYNQSTLRTMRDEVNETITESVELEQQVNDDDYDDDDEMGGSLQSLLDLLPLAAPILEDLSDPNSDTDLAEVLQAAIPLVQGLSEGNGEDAVDIPGALVPILVNLSGGKDGKGSDVAAIAGPLIQLIAPLIGPLVGPLIGPLSRSSNAPYGEGGSSLSALVKAVAGPLSTPTGPGKTSPFSNLVAGVVSSLSKELSVPTKGGYGTYGPYGGGGGSDLGTLISTVVSGLIAGASSGLSGSSKHKDSAYAPTSYGDYGGYGAYGPAPANMVNPSNLLGNSIKGIINGVLQLVTSLLKAVTGVLGASSQDPGPAYGPPQPPYGQQTTTGASAYAYNPYANSFTGEKPPPPRQSSVIKRII